MKRSSKIKVLSFAKFQAVLGAVIGLICGILYSFGGLLIDVLVSIGWLSPAVMSTPGLSLGTLLAFGALIGMPILFAMAGYLLGIAESLLYNLLVRWLGGLEIDFEQK